MLRFWTERKLGSPDPEVRLQALRALVPDYPRRIIRSVELRASTYRQTQHDRQDLLYPQTLSTLSRDLDRLVRLAREDADERVRVLARDTLERALPYVIPTLLDVLSLRVEGARHVAGEALIAGGRIALGPLRELLTSPDSVWRYRPNRDAVERILHAIDPEWMLLDESAPAAAKITEHLLAQINSFSYSPDVLEEAQRLSPLLARDPEPLIHWLKEGPSGRRHRATLLMEVIGGEQIIQALVEGLNDIEVRDSCARALQTLSWTPTLADSRSVTYAILTHNARLLRSMGGAVIDGLVARISELDSRGIDLLGEVASKDAVPAILGFLVSADLFDQERRHAAFRALDGLDSGWRNLPEAVSYRDRVVQVALNGSDRQVDALISTLEWFHDDPSAEALLAIMRTTRNMGPNDESGDGWSGLRYVESHEQWTAIRTKAAFALSDFRYEPARGTWHVLLEEERGELASAARRALNLY